MAKQFPTLDDRHCKFIAEQHIFFTASAGPDGPVNISPKGMDSLHILAPDRILWVNLTGSGNETAGHLLRDPRLTLMWCSFTARPLILRAYGTARAVHVTDANWPVLAAHFPPLRSARQIIDMEVDMVQTSCGYAVPFMEYKEERPTMAQWVADRSDAQLRAYWEERNTSTLDGHPTGIPQPDHDD
jgi:pyridoxamine 5'-phosphate oxidase-like protein